LQSYLIKSILHKIEIKKINRWLKRLTFFLFFIGLANCTEKERQSSFPEQKPVTPPIESKPLPEVPKAPEKPVRRKKPKHTSSAASPVEQPSVAIFPIERNPIELLSVQSEIGDLVNTTDIFIQMERLAAGSFSSYYKVRRFYIPPVEYKLNPKDLIVPASLITIGALASHTDKFRNILPITRSHPKDRKTPVDDVAQLVVAPSLFIFDALGNEKHHPVDQFFLTALSYGITVFPTRYIKNHYTSPRPYGGNHSFPSGHTATAFVGSHIIYKEFKDSNPWIACSGYAMGVFVAGSRVAHDKHWVSDVMAGAGIAILSTELAYWIYFPIRNLITDKANKLFGNYLLLSPVIQPNTLGVNFSMTW
jgi:hypothetical protein